jgi:hypothetical protein
MGSNLISTATLQDHFHHLVVDAMLNQHVEGTDETKHYLTSLLVSFMSVDMLFDKDEQGMRIKPLAIMYGEAFQEHNPALRYQSLRKLGDTALFISGMFPGVLHRKPIGLDYYIAMGGNAYGLVSDLVTRVSRSKSFVVIFAELGQGFAQYVDVLSEVAEHSNMTNPVDLLEMYEQWLQTGSRRLAKKLRNAGIEPEIPVGKKFH